jgi:hypothetical protein
LASVENEAPLPRPIDNGQVDQTVVEYTGPRLGAATYRGRSGREYRFDASPRDKRKYVLAEDLDRFRLRPDFRVLEETRIDPEAEKLKAMETAVGDRMVKEVTRLLAPKGTAKRKDAQRRRGGRPPGRGFGAMLDCWMTCGRVGDYYGSSKEAYDAIDRYLGDHALPDQHIPPRERFSSARSDAKRERERAGRCVWHKHPEPVPQELIPA